MSFLARFVIVLLVHILSVEAVHEVSAHSNNVSDNFKKNETWFCHLELNIVMTSPPVLHENETTSLQNEYQDQHQSRLPYQFHRHHLRAQQSQQSSEQPEQPPKESEDDVFFSCRLQNKNHNMLVGSYHLPYLPPRVVEQVLTPLHQGQDLVLQLQNPILDFHHSIHVEHDTDIRVVTLEEDQPDPLQSHRQLRKPPSMGALRTVLLRVSTADSAPPHTSDELAEYLYSTTPSARSQFEACSAGQLTLQAPIVLDVVLSNTFVADVTPQALVTLAETKANQMLTSDPTSDIDNVRSWTQLLMVVLPPGTGNWAAYAVVGGKMSVFNNVWGARLGPVMHELGHNLGLRHAYQNGVEYAGVTGYMGGATIETLYPRQCYNGPNHYQLGWFGPDHVLEIDEASLGTTQVVRVAAFVDFDRILALATTTNDIMVVVLKIGDLYAQFNLAQRHNVETRARPNELVIVRQMSLGTDLLGGLGRRGDQASFALTSTGTQVYFSLCDVQVHPNAVSYMEVRIQSGSAASCEDEISSSPAPTTAIPTTRPPTLRPTTRAPTTSRPTQTPTFSPTMSPSTPLPTIRAPSPSPTSAAPTTFNPTGQPASSPVWPPSNWRNHVDVPTLHDSLAPSGFPSEVPSLLEMSNIPSLFPSVSEMPSLSTEPSTSNEPSPESSSMPSLLFVINTSSRANVIQKEQDRRGEVLWIILLVFGLLLLLGLLAMSILCCRRSKRRNQSRPGHLVGLKSTTESDTVTLSSGLSSLALSCHDLNATTEEDARNDSCNIDSMELPADNGGDVS